MVLSFLSNHSVQQDVLGVPHAFYPISVRTLFRLRGISATLAKSVTTLLSGGPARDLEKKRRDTREGGGPDGAFQSEEETRLKAIDPRLHEQMHLHRQAAIDDLIGVLLHESNVELFVDIIEDSLRIPKTDRCKTSAEKTKSVEDLSLDAAMEIVMGIIAANKRIFDPLGRLGREFLARTKENETDEKAPQSQKATTGD